MKPGEIVRIEVTAIANGFLLVEAREDKNYHRASSEPLFYPSLGAIEAELVIRFRAAQELPLGDQPDF